MWTLPPSGGDIKRFCTAAIASGLGLVPMGNNGWNLVGATILVGAIVGAESYFSQIAQR